MEHKVKKTNDIKSVLPFCSLCKEEKLFISTSPKQQQCKVPEANKNSELLKYFTLHSLLSGNNMAFVSLYQPLMSVMIIAERVY